MTGTITPGYLAEVLVSGTAATLTTEATTKSGGNKVFQITDPTKRVLSPTATITQNWSAGPTGTITVNRLTGTFTSTADETTHTLTISGTGAYLPMAQLLYCKEYSLDADIKLEDVTPLYSAYQVVDPVSRKASGTLGNFFDAAEVAGLSIAPYFTTQMIAEATFALKLYVHANLSLLVWARINNEKLKAAIDGEQEETVAWMGNADNDGHVLSRL